MGQRGTCLLVSLLLLAGAQTSVNASNGRCTDGGVSYPNGQVFQRPGNSQCVLHRCVNGNVDPHREACQFRTGCLRWGSTLTHDCITYTCMKSSPHRRGEPFYWLDVIRADCRSGGVCHPRGSTFRENCTTYTCTEPFVQGVLTAKAVETSRGCLRDGVCHYYGSTFQENCTTYTCTGWNVEGVLTGEPVVISRKCWRDGVCRPRGYTYTGGCRTFTCTGQADQTYVSYGGFRITYSCPLHNGTCLESGSQFLERGSGGVVIRKCNCTIHPTHYLIACSGVTLAESLVL